MIQQQREQQAALEERLRKVEKRANAAQQKAQTAQQQQTYVEDRFAAARRVREEVKKERADAQ